VVVAVAVAVAAVVVAAAFATVSSVVSDNACREGVVGVPEAFADETVAIFRNIYLLFE